MGRHDIHPSHPLALRDRARFLPLDFFRSQHRSLPHAQSRARGELDAHEPFHRSLRGIGHARGGRKFASKRQLGQPRAALHRLSKPARVRRHAGHLRRPRRIQIAREPKHDRLLDTGERRPGQRAGVAGARAVRQCRALGDDDARRVWRAGVSPSEAHDVVVDDIAGQEEGDDACAAQEVARSGIGPAAAEVGDDAGFAGASGACAAPAVLARWEILGHFEVGALILIVTEDIVF